MTYRYAEEISSTMNSRYHIAGTHSQSAEFQLPDQDTDRMLVAIALQVVDYYINVPNDLASWGFLCSKHDFIT